MAMTWDSPLVASVARALGDRLEGARLRALHLDHGDRSLVLWFREATLAVRLHPERGALTLHEPRDPPAEARPLQARLREIDAPPDDRILSLAFLKVRGRNPRWDVTLELMTNQWNAVVTEGPERVLRHVLREREGRRSLGTGAVYAAPPPSDREGRDGELSLARWREILLPEAPRRRRGALLRGVAWTSPLNAPALLGAAAEEGGGDDVEAALEAGYALWRRLAAVGSGAGLDATADTDEAGLDAAADEAGPRPAAVVLDPDGGSPQPYPIPLPHRPSRAAPDILAAMATAAETEGATGRAVLVPSEVVDALEDRVEGALKRVERLRAELAGAPDPAATRAVGDLLLARFGEVPRGAAHVRLTGFDGEPVDVELDPALPVHGNAERYYDRAGRAERARARLPALIDAAREEADGLRALLQRVRSGEADPEEAKAALPDRAPAGGEPGGGSATLPYRRYRSSGGLEIRVGRGSKRNDDLTFHHSSPDDVWLHARYTAGAHVILRWAGEGNPPARDLAEAATLAALHSKARTSGSVPVDWTRRKYVRKPRKAPPGAVLPDRVSTLFVEPDEALETRLREE